MKQLLLTMAKLLQKWAGEEPKKQQAKPKKEVRELGTPAKALLEEYEGREAKAYKDSGGAWTIGVGHLLTRSELKSGKLYINGEAVKWGKGLTEAQIDELYAQDIAKYTKAVDGLVKVALTGGQYGALVSFCYNVGIGAFKGSTLLKRLNAGRYKDVPAQLRRWVYDGDDKIDGLKNRREKEIKQWKS